MPQARAVSVVNPTEAATREAAKERAMTGERMPRVLAEPSKGVDLSKTPWTATEKKLGWNA